jgi:hypothetical protein
LRSLFDIDLTLQLKHLLPALCPREDIDRRKKNKPQRAFDKRKNKERKVLVTVGREVVPRCRHRTCRSDSRSRGRTTTTKKTLSIEKEDL